MKRGLWALAVAVPLIALLASGFGHDPSAASSPLIGRPAPSFSLRTLSNKTLSLRDLRGRPVVLNFWASWCTSCKQEHGTLLDAWHRYGQRVAFVGILLKDSASGARGYMHMYGGGWPSLQDPRQATAIDYGVAGPPETFVIDRSGVVRAKVIGPLALDVLQRMIRSELERKP